MSSHKIIKISAKARRLDDIIDIIKMIVNSRRFGVTLQQLNEDYHVLCDEPVPYNEFGCASLCTFLKYWPEKFRVIEKLLDIPILVPIDPAVLYFFPKFMFQVSFPNVNICYQNNANDSN